MNKGFTSYNQLLFHHINDRLLEYNRDFDKTGSVKTAKIK